MRSRLVLGATLLLGLQGQSSQRPAHDWSRFDEGTRASFRVKMETPTGSSEGMYVQVLGAVSAQSYRLDELFDLGGPVERVQEWRKPEPVGEGPEVGLGVGGAEGLAVCRRELGSS